MEIARDRRSCGIGCSRPRPHHAYHTHTGVRTQSHREWKSRIPFKRGEEEKNVLLRVHGARKGCLFRLCSVVRIVHTHTKDAGRNSTGQARSSSPKRFFFLQPNPKPRRILPLPSSPLSKAKGKERKRRASSSDHIQYCPVPICLPTRNRKRMKSMKSEKPRKSHPNPRKKKSSDGAHGKGGYSVEKNTGSTGCIYSTVTA